MADQKISQLTDGTSFQAGDEAVVNRSGTNYKVDPTQFGSSIDVNGRLNLQSSAGTSSILYHGNSLTATGPSANLSFGNRQNGAILFFTNDTEAMRIDSSGNLLVGKTTNDNGATAGIELEASGQLNVAISGSFSRFARLNNDGDIVQFLKDTTTVGSIGITGGDLLIGTGDVKLRFDDGSDGLTPRNADGTGRSDAIDLGNSATRFKDLYLSGGVYLGGTGAANLLDDYEEGTWTPVVADAATGGNTATGTFTGSYVKVGKLVTVQCTLVNIDTTGLTAGNILHIRSLPFASSSSNNSTAQPRVENVAYVDSIAVLLGDNRTFAYLRSNTQGSSSTNVNVSDVTSGTGDITFTLSYETT